MAKLRGIGTRLTGSAGDWTYAETAVGTVAKQKVPAHNNSRTYAQMRRRVQWCNILNLWNSFEGNLHPSFEGRAAGVSDYNAFIQANLGIVSVYLRKDEANAKGVVVAEYQVTRGSLPEIIHNTSAGGTPVTDISLGGLTIGPTTTLKAFSDAVCNNNAQFHNGDQISCFRIQQAAYANGIPYVNILAEEVTLDRSDEETLLYDVCSGLCFESVGGVLGTSTAIAGGQVWIHSRKQNGKTLVSTQRIVCSNPVLPRYQSVAQLEAAIASYGGVLADQFLTPNVTDIVEPEAA